MNVATKEQLKAAERLVSGPGDRPEDNVRQDICRLLDTLGIDNILTHRTDAGPADIYLPRRRLFIETKAVGLADRPDEPQARESNESPREQLERYLRSEISFELDIELPEDNDVADPSWIGIVTDGRVWHAWRYPHQEGVTGRVIFTDFRPADPRQLLSRVGDLFSRTAIGKAWIPANPNEILSGFLDRLHEIHGSLDGRRQIEAQTKMDLWIDMLRTSSMAPDNPHAQVRLFAAHSFLVAVARGVIHTLAHKEKPIPGDILGEGFASWVLSTTPGTRWANDLLGCIHSYEWRRRRGDVLRPLYEAIVGDSDRKMFGEYYTPDWLAELLVETVLDDRWCENSVAASLKADRDHQELKGIGMLDPACGSGTFLYHAARKLLGTEEIRSLPKPRRAGVVASLVHGIDIHPVAAEIARATVLRALPAEPPDGPAAIRVFQGDSLNTLSYGPDSLFRPVNGEYEISTPTGEQMHIPKSFASDRSFADNLRRMVDAAVLGNEIPPDVVRAVPDEDRQALRECHKSLKVIIEKEGNSVWAWYVTNITAPQRLSERKVDRILANPPWVKMADIQVEDRKRVLEVFADKRLGLWTGGKQAPHFDIAQLFLKQARNLYLQDPASDPAAWIVKKAAINAGNWKKFREWHREIQSQTLDLQSLQPFGGGDARRCCVFLENRSLRQKKRRPSDFLVAALSGKDRPTADMSLREAQELFVFKPSTAQFDDEQSGYLDSRDNPVFRNGATVTPKVLVVVDDVEGTGPTGQTMVITARSNKHRWVEVEPQRGAVPTNWVRNLIVSENLYPFAISDQLTQALIPVDSGDSLIANPAAESEFWNRLEEIWDEFRGKGRSTPPTLIAQINYAGKLDSQLPLSPHCSRKIVLYPRSGDHMRACRTSPCLVDGSLYRWEAPTAREAAYLTALLNAPCLNKAFVQSRESGRDFHLHPWRKIPIPRFDPDNDDHVALAQLTNRTEKAASEWLSQSPAIRGQVMVSRRIRELLRDMGIFADIDSLARNVLPDHTAAVVESND